VEAVALLESIGIIAAILLGTWGLLRSLRRDRKEEVNERIERATRINTICNKIDALADDVRDIRSQVDNHIPTRLAALEARLSVVETKVDELPSKEYHEHQSSSRTQGPGP
jgi:chromosome segregation ATPase